MNLLARGRHIIPQENKDFNMIQIRIPDVAARVSGKIVGSVPLFYIEGRA